MSMPEFAMTYVVYWPDARVLKVGRAAKWSRLERLMRAGAQIIVCQRGTDKTWEREALRVLARWFPRAFTGWEDSERVLGRGGKGHTECFTVDEHDLQFALDRCIQGFARGNDRRVEAEVHQSRRLGVQGVSGHPGRGETDRAVAVATPGPAGTGADGPGVDRGGDAPAPRLGRDSRDDLRASGDADGLRVSDHVSRGRRRVAAVVAPVEGRQARHPGRYTGAADDRPGLSMGVRGCGGRARGGAGAREGAGAGGGRGASGCVGGGARGPGDAAGAARTPADAGCPADVLRRAHAAWCRSEEVRTLPRCSIDSRRMAPPQGLRGTSHRLSRADERVIS